MTTENVTTIVVEMAGKYGPKVDGTYLGTKRPLKATDFVTGGKYDILTESWNSNGKSGLNITKIVKDYGNSNGASLKPAVDWAAKDRSQLIGGVYHDAGDVVRLSLEFDKPIKDILVLHKEATLGLLENRKEVK